MSTMTFCNTTLSTDARLKISVLKFYITLNISVFFRSTRPSVHTMPKSFHAKSQQFTSHLGKCGMYKNNSLNTVVDKSRASGHLDGLF